MPAPVFQSSDQFRQHFIRQLHTIADEAEIGVFILVLANAISKPEIFASLKDTLTARFQFIKKHLTTVKTRSMNAIPADDLEVFKALGELDFSSLPLASKKTLGHWQLQFNALRSFRPVRTSQQKVCALFQPFDDNSFHFNKPFLAREKLWQGVLAGTQTRILYNKFPFADYHALLVLNPEARKPQFLEQQDCLLTQEILEEMRALDGIGMAYNSLGAYASVNHQHWHLFLSENDYPVESALWKHNNGPENYPVGVDCFHSLSEAWPVIDKYQQLQHSFNLFARPHRTYLVRRRKQGDYLHSEWTSGYAWSEMMGNIVTTRAHDYRNLNARTIEQEFQRLKLESAVEREKDAYQQ